MDHKSHKDCNENCDSQSNLHPIPIVPQNINGENHSEGSLAHDLRKRNAKVQSDGATHGQHELQKSSLFAGTSRLQIHSTPTTAQSNLAWSVGRIKHRHSQPDPRKDNGITLGRSSNAQAFRHPVTPQAPSHSVPLPGIMAKTVQTPLTGEPIIPVCRAKFSYNSMENDTQQDVGLRSSVEQTIADEFASNNMPPPPVAVTPYWNRSKMVRQQVPNNDNNDQSVESEKKGFSGPEVIQERTTFTKDLEENSSINESGFANSSNTFQDNSDGLGRDDRDTRDGLSIFSSTFLDLNVGIDISRSSILQDHAAMIDEITELEAIKNLAQTSLADNPSN